MSQQEQSGQPGQASPTPTSPPPHLAFPPMQQHVQGAPLSAQHAQENLDGTQAKLGKLEQGEKLLGFVVKQLGTLSKQGDSIKPEDVVDAAAKMVSKGVDATQLASVMADMPGSNGAQLAGWVENYFQKSQQQLEKLTQLREQAQHESGIAAIHHLVGVAAGQGAGQSPDSSSTPTPTPSSNPLALGASNVPA